MSIRGSGHGHPRGRGAARQTRGPCRRESHQHRVVVPERLHLRSDLLHEDLQRDVVAHEPDRHQHDRRIVRPDAHTSSPPRHRSRPRRGRRPPRAAGTRLHLAAGSVDGRGLRGGAEGHRGDLDRRVAAAQRREQRGALRRARPTGAAPRARRRSGPRRAAPRCPRRGGSARGAQLTAGASCDSAASRSSSEVPRSWRSRAQQRGAGQRQVARRRRRRRAPRTPRHAPRASRASRRPCCAAPRSASRPRSRSAARPAASSAR